MCVLYVCVHVIYVQVVSVCVCVCKWYACVCLRAYLRAYYLTQYFQSLRLWLPSTSPAHTSYETLKLHTYMHITCAHTNTETKDPMYKRGFCFILFYFMCIYLFDREREGEWWINIVSTPWLLMK